VPSLLEGVYLGMTLGQARVARPAMSAPRDADPGEPGVRLMEERSPNGARAVYVFEEGNLRRQRLQVLSLLPDTAAIAPHLAAMNDQYGSPTGAWDCPDTGGVRCSTFDSWRLLARLLVGSPVTELGRR